jgi:hypothetical protein
VRKDSGVRNQGSDLAGAIRTKSFLEPVPVSIGPNWRMIRRAAFLMLFSVLCILLSVLCSGCTAPLISSNIDIDANGNTTTVPLVGQ